MFELLDTPLHWIPVKWKALLPPKKKDALSVPGEHEIELRVEIVGREEAKRMFPELFDVADAVPVEGFDIFKQVVKEWRKISANGQAVPLNDENIKRLLNVPCFLAAFATAYVTALSGAAEVREELRRLAERWASGYRKSRDDAFKRDCDRFGLDPTAFGLTVENENVPIWPDMKEAVALFFAMQTQWLWVGAGMGGAIRTGLNYPALKPTAELSGVTMTSALFNDIRTLEQTALETWSRKR